MTAAVPTCSAQPAAPVRTRGPSATSDMAYPSALPNDPIASPLGQLHGVVFDRRRLTTSVALISAHGDIDATNADAMTEYALADVVRCQGLVLDLCGLSFCGTAGFVSLQRISVGYAAAGRAWTIVSGPAVSRLLAMCDPAGALPCADTMNVALTSIQHQRQVTHA
jgi:anti-anti-sigma regulatory factor